MADSMPVFLDTAYVFALINTRDQWHAKAKTLEREFNADRRPLVTSEFVLMEIADGLSALHFRQQAIHVIDTLTRTPHATIVTASSEVYEAGLELFRRRNDKQWGLTDCTSFVIMQQQGLRHAPTTDIHFRQAGFQVLMLET